MGRVGAACDNAAMESFFSLLRKNVLDTRRWETARNSASRSLGRIVFKARRESPLTGYARRDSLSGIHIAAIWRVRPGFPLVNYLPVVPSPAAPT